MGCHTWTYVPIKESEFKFNGIEFRKIPRHKIIEILSKNIRDSWGIDDDNLDSDDKSEFLDYAISILCDQGNLDKSFKGKYYSSLTDDEKKVLYESINKIIDDSINLLFKSSNKKLLLNFIEYISDKNRLYTYYKNKIYYNNHFDYPFRILGYPDRYDNPIRSYKSFRRFIYKSYNNKNKSNYGYIDKLPTNGEWKSIKRFFRDNKKVFIEFG